MSGSQRNDNGAVADQVTEFLPDPNVDDRMDRRCAFNVLQLKPRPTKTL